MKNWSEADIPSQRSKVAIVTGASSGLGYEIARALAEKQAAVILAARNESKGREAVDRIRSQMPNADIRYEHLDLADLASVRDFAANVNERAAAVDMLVNNAGLAMVPARQTTLDGFELQLGTNYLGHFLLTSELLPSLLRAANARVVAMSSIGHRMGPLDFDDLHGERKYAPGLAYGRSKLAMLLFGRELQRVSDSKGWRLTSIPVHPGVSQSNLMINGPRLGGRSLFHDFTQHVLIPLIGQSAARGALPALFAATSPDAHGGVYYGPTGWAELKGPPGPAKVAPHAQDQQTQTRLWDISVGLTGARWAP